MSLILQFLKKGRFSKSVFLDAILLINLQDKSKNNVLIILLDALILMSVKKNK